MALSLTASTDSQNPSFLMGQNYQLSLKQSMEDLLAETQKETPNFSGFIEKFYGLMQAKVDPPLESIWVYSALSFRSHSFSKEDHLCRLSIINDLFQLVSSCSSPCNSSKSIALLAPIVFEVYKLVVEVLGKDSGSKGEKKVNKKIKSVVEVIIGYISMCCCKGFSEESEGIDVDLAVPVEDLASIWIDRNANLQSFLPLVSHEVCGLISERGFDLNYFAGVVMVESFLLKLCLDIRIGDEGMVVLENELRSWAVASISSFHNSYFFEMLMRILLQPALPVTALLGPEEVILLRNILFDVIILVENSFLKPETVPLPTEHVKSIAITRLVVTLEAIELFRKNRDKKRATRYMSAFTNSDLPSQITKWISSLNGMFEKAGGISGSSPKALIKSLLKLEKQGIKLFNDSVLKYHAKSLVDDSMEVDEQLVSKKLKDDEPSFYIDDKGEEEVNEMKNESMTAVYVAAARSMRPIDKSRDKRKGSGGEEKEKIKYFKYALPSKSKARKEASVPGSGSDSDSGASKDDLSSDSEVENPVK
ncbi:Plasma membrane [Hibiscus syriacus]|uniref:Plasma membrane n=1 Tax=Hibiscus syriacus TaxID=106335 RepID=A0A6A2Z8V5_HIBSY|nr:uncharacterized protein LOC120150032 [Hibiscus syriacus]KAE8687545.1 Plasma membrane [Hibiscus syriacus]